MKEVFFPGPVQLSLSSSSGSGVIRYTTDGSKPGSTSLIYNTPIIINKNTIVRARVFEAVKLPGKIITNSYFINEIKNLPAISLVTEPSLLWDRQIGIYLNNYKNKEIPVSLEYFPNTSKAFGMDAGASIGGENIYRFAQKPLNIIFRSDYGQGELNYQMFDDTPFDQYKELYLRNSGSDWTTTMFRDGLIVNVLKNRVANSLQNYRPAVMYLNGQFWGINNIREKVNDDFLSMHYNISKNDIDHIDDSYRVISGDSTDFVDLVNFINSNSMANQANYDYVATKILVHDIMDFVIAQDYVANSSWGHNREMWREKRTEKLWRWILTDMDRGFDANRLSVNQLADIFNNFTFFRKLCENESFKNDFIQRYSEHLNHTFNYSRVVSKIDSIKSLIENEMPRHIEKWGTLIDSLSIDGGFGKHGGIPSMDAWYSEVQNLRDFSAQRTNYVIQYLNQRFGLTGRANLKITSNATYARVDVNGFYETPGENNLYFKNVPLAIKAFAPQGYRFKQWMVFSVDSNVTASLIPSASVWKYYDGSSVPGGAWNSSSFNDSGWKTGNAQFGYGDGDENTVISFGPNSQDRYITSYYRSNFNVDNPTNVSTLTLRILCDDGSAVYINGNEVLRTNMPAGQIEFSTPALSAVSGTDETAFTEYTIDKSYLVKGQNVIAVEVHQSGPASSDISFDLSLNAVFSQPAGTWELAGTDPSINYTIRGETELRMVFEKMESAIVPEILNEPLTLTKSVSPYFIINDVNIGANAVLNIEPGVTIYFSPGKNIYVKGKILMEGTEAEPIVLQPYFSEESWGAVCFDNSSGVSELNHVNISGSTYSEIDSMNFFAAVSSLNSTVNLRHVNFYDVMAPISSQYSNMVIDGCRMEKVTHVGDYVNATGGSVSILNSLFIGNSIEDMDAIDLGSFNGNVIVRNNVFRDFTGNNSDGVDLGENSLNVVVDSNLIINCFDKGISVGAGSSAIVRHNTIVNCGMGLGIKDSLSSAEIENCTFYNDGIGVDCYEKVLNRGGGRAVIKNSIFANSIQAPFLIDDESRITVSYSISNTSSLPGAGNILGDPQMINPMGLNFYLQTGSNCIDSGDPASQADIDGTRNDIGAYTYAGTSDPVLVINEINYNSSNSFNPGDWIELYNADEGPLNVSGWVLVDDNKDPAFVINAGTIMHPSSFLVLCRDSAAFQALFTNVRICQGNMSHGLNAGGEQLYLYDISGRLVDSLTYDNKQPWPAAPDGGGSTLELINPGLENAQGINWSASKEHGTPGAVNSSFVAEVEGGDNLPKEYLLNQNYPNPFNPTTTISYQLPKDGLVTLKIYDVIGNEVTTLVNQYNSAGSYEVQFNAANLASGIYFYSIKVNDYSAAKKLILMK